YHGGAEQAQDVFNTGLLTTEKFLVTRREWTDSILKAKCFSLAGAADPKIIIKMGKLLGVQYLMMGDLTEYGNKVAGSAGSAGIGNLPSFTVHKKIFVASMGARLFNTL